MDRLKVIELTSAILTTVGCFIIMIPNISAFYILVVSNLFGAVVYYKKLHWFFFCQAIALTIFNIFTIYRWPFGGIG